MLEDGESPNNFDTCRCGGSLKYYKDIEGLFEENNENINVDENIKTKVYKSSDQ